MKKSALTLALAFALPGLAVAGAPVNYGSDGSADNQWGINGDGTIDFVCPTGWTCGANPVSDKEFYQVEMSDGTNTYFRTIIATGAPVTGGDGSVGESFSTESFVKMGGTGGIAAQQTMANSTAGQGVLSTSTTLATGEFNAGENQVDMTQNVWGDNSAAPDFHAGFTFSKSADGTVTNTGLTQEISANLGTQDGFADSFNYSQTKTSGVATATSLDIVSGVVLNEGSTNLNDQAFRYVVREGTAVAGAGSADLTAGSVAWASGEAVERVLVGQNVTGAGAFGYERVGNTTTASEQTQFDLAATGPFATINGTDPFGAPADPGAISVTAVTIP